MITVSLSLALCTIMFRRFMDSFTGRIPLVMQSSTAPNTTALFMLSGVLYYLYSHLKKGTLVRVGQGHTRHAYNSSHLRLPMQRRSRNNSWFLRNARACRKKCTDAMYKIAKQSYESLHNLNPCLLLPSKNFQICFTKIRSDSHILQENKLEKVNNVCNIIYSNESFDRESNQNINSEVKSSSLQTSDQSAEKSERIVRKRSGVCTLKRLNDGCKLRDDSNMFLKKNKGIKRMTRSGKIYSHFQ